MGRTGRDAVFDLLAGIKDEYNIDFTIANGENSAGGLGMTAKTYAELSRAGVDFFTMGNHTFSKKEIVRLFADGENIVRPANMPEGTPGSGMEIVTVNGIKIAIINLIGKIFLDENNSSPFEAGLALAQKAREKTPVIIVDFHAEATSEKEALGYFLDGKVSAVFGTHTHIQTADERILPLGTGYITDVGRTGAYHSVLGMDTEVSIKRLTCSPDEKKLPFTISKNSYELCAVVVKINEETGKTEEIKRLCLLQK